MEMIVARGRTKKLFEAVFLLILWSRSNRAIRRNRFSFSRVSIMRIEDDSTGRIFCTAVRDLIWSSWRPLFWFWLRLSEDSGNNSAEIGDFSNDWPRTR